MSDDSTPALRPGSTPEVDTAVPLDRSRVDRILERLEENPLARELTPRRLRRLVEVATCRLTSVRAVIENLWDPHNVSAVVRTAEGLGIDEVSVVEDPHRYKVNRGVAHGADRWLRISRFSGLDDCLRELGSAGFTTCAADLGPGCVPLDALPADRPLALVFGSEKAGLTTAARERADLRFTVPMAGFTGSFNVSVSAALALFSVTQARRSVLGQGGDLDDSQVLGRVGEWLELTTVSGKAQRRLAGTKRLK